MSRWTKALVWFAVWTGVGLFFSTQLILINTYLYHRKVELWYAIVGTLPQWYMWFLLTPAVLWMARHFPVSRANWRSRIPIHLLGAIVSALLVVKGYAGIAHLAHWDLGGNTTYLGKLMFLLSVDLHIGLVTYAVVVSVIQGAAYYRHSQEREARLAQAQLQVLRSQLHPHFLFNALHTTLALVRKDPPAAERMIVRLGELLRATLDSSAVAEVPLRQELQFLEQYLDIERTRFADRLCVDMQIDPQTLDIRVPNMILQPLVENAVKHGISPRSAPGHIVVKAARENGHLKLEVSDDGVGLQGAVKEGIGLSNTRARLRQLYGDRQSLRLETPSGGGFSAKVEIPTDAQ